MSIDNIKAKLESEKQAIDNCEKQVIHELDYISSYGFLLAYDISSKRITHVSENISECLRFTVKQLLDEEISTALPESLVHACNNASAHSTIEDVREFVGNTEHQGKTYSAYAHKSGQSIIIELQNEQPDSVAQTTIIDQTQRILERLKRHDDINDLMAHACEELRALNGYDRVKTYKFLSDGAGEVIAESRVNNIDSFLGLRFPAFDIPQAARVLYIKTPVRVIPSVSDTPCKILKSKSETKNLDLSLALHRGVVPVHGMYLENMGVQGTMSLPIVVNGRMWGLFACHHNQPIMPCSALISACQIIVKTISMMMVNLLNAKRLQKTQQCKKTVSNLFAFDDSPLSFSAYWNLTKSELAALISCDGVALISDSRVDRYGECPSNSNIRLLISHIEQQGNTDEHPPIAIDSLTSFLDKRQKSSIAGMLAIPIFKASYQYLIFFRCNAKQHVKWAGNPEKVIEQSNHEFRLHPRGSFKAYVDEVQEYSDKFSEDELLVASVLQETLVSALDGISMQNLHRNHLGLMVRELNHRVKNILSLVASLVSQSKTNNNSLEDFVLTIEKRIIALTETHKLLSEFEWTLIDINILLERALLPYLTSSKKRIFMNGSNEALSSELASLLSLVIFELGSNAVKYGALSNDSGYVELNWFSGNDHLTILWREIDGPKVTPPTNSGFGSSLIKEALHYEFEAKCDIKYLASGLEAKFVIPYKSEPTSQNSLPDLVSQPPFKGLPPVHSFIALLLEDDYVIAKEMHSMLKNIGASRVDVAPSLEKAQAFIEKNNYDIAIIDANIRGEFSGSIAQSLQNSSIPFAFVTGYGSKDQKLNDIDCIDVISKPISEQQLIALIHSAGIF